MDYSYFVTSSLVWLICWALYYLVLRHETAFRMNRYYLLGTFLLGLSWPLWMAVVPATPLAEVLPTQTLETVVVGSWTESPVMQTATPAWPWYMLLYWLGCGLVALRLFWQLGALVRIIAGGTRSWRGGVCYVAHPMISQAGSWFCFMFLPVQSARLRADRYEIELHELAHIRQGHSWDILLLEIGGIAFWWNPLWYAYSRSLRQVHEYLADAAVLRQSSIRHYAQLLVRQASPSSSLRLVSTFYTSPLKQRIIMMTKKSPRLRTLLKYALVLPLLALLVLTCADSLDDTAADEIALTETEDPAAAAEDGKVYKEVDQMPVFGDCEGLDGDALQQCSQSNLLEYIYTNVKYPAEAKEKGVEGITVSEIIISEEGEVIEAKAARVEGVDPLLREAALEVVENLPRFRPGLHQGKAVKVSYYIPIRFQLD